MVTTHSRLKLRSYVDIIHNKIHRRELNPDINLSAASERWIRHFAPKYDKLSPEFLRGPPPYPPGGRFLPSQVLRPAFKLSSLINYSQVGYRGYEYSLT